MPRGGRRRGARGKGRGRKKKLAPSLQGRPEWDSSGVHVPAAPTVSLSRPAASYRHPAAEAALAWDSPYAGTYYDVILREAESMRNFSVAGGLSGAMTKAPPGPPRFPKARTPTMRGQQGAGTAQQHQQHGAGASAPHSGVSSGTGGTQGSAAPGVGADPLQVVSQKLEQARAQALTEPYTNPGEWQPKLHKPFQAPFRSTYSAFGSSTASPRRARGADGGWYWFGKPVAQPPSAVATALAEKDAYAERYGSVPRPGTAGQEGAGAGRGGHSASSASLRAWKRDGEPLSGQARPGSGSQSQPVLRQLPPKGRADLAMYGRSGSSQGQRRRRKLAPKGPGLRASRRWPQCAFAPTRETLLDLPRHGVGLAHKPDERVYVPSPQHYDQERPWKKGVLQRARTAPAYTLRSRLKTLKEMAVATGHKEPPAPGAQVKVPSFAEDDRKIGKGVVFGHKLDSPRTIARRLGMLDGPAPGGEAPVVSFVEENARRAKGVAWTPPPPSAAVKQYEQRLAQSHVWRDVKQPGKEQMGRPGTYMLKDIPYPPPKEAQDPGAPQPHMAAAPSFVAEDLKQGKGVIFGSSRPPFLKIDDSTPAPGGTVKIPSFVEEDRKQGKGVAFGHRLKTRAEIEERLGIPQTPGVGHYSVETKPVTPVASPAVWSHAGARVKKVFDRPTT